MIKSLIITHGGLGKELIKVCEKIFNKNIDIEYICFNWQEDGTSAINKLENFIEKNKGNKIMIFTDMFGGSPSNICFEFVDKNIEVITGINLPGLLKFLTYREKNMDFKKLAKIVKKGAIEGVNIIGEYLGEKND